MEGGSAPNKGAATGGWSVPGLDEASQSILADVAERTAREEEFLGTKKKAADARILRQEGGLSDDIDFGSVPQVRRGAERRAPRESRGRCTRCRRRAACVRAGRVAESGSAGGRQSYHANKNASETEC